MKGLYKKLEDNTWLYAEIEVNSKQYHLVVADYSEDIELNDGWSHYMEAPQEYNEWLKTLEII